MEKYTIEKDITVFCVTAKSFPDGVMEAYNTLYSFFPNPQERHYYGLSRPEGGSIVYKAAVEEKEEGEAEKFGCERFVIPKGTYIGTVIKDFMKDLPAIGSTFQAILGQQGLDPNGYCVEDYINERDVKCMVRLDPANS